jgi:Glucose / Sorbosone dehydrogenase/PKD domain
VYLYYTARKAGSCVNRVSRFVWSEGNVLSNESVLVDNMPLPNGNHNAGDLHFGKDGFLYISVGDGGCDYAGPTRCADLNDAARDPHVLIGKVLRITSTGGIPLGNPFVGPGSARCNVFGQTALGQAGADYGWNVREGHCRTGSQTDCGQPPAGMTNPIFAYSRTATDPIFAGCASISGGAFVPAGVWPAELEGAYLFSDYVCGKIFSLSPSHTATSFATDLGGSSAVTLLFGPHEGTQALYYTTFTNGGQVRRIAFVGSANRAPAAVGNATPTNGPVPLPVAFSANESSDPDGDPLAFEWDFGDGTPPIGASETAHVYGTAGTLEDLPATTTSFLEVRLTATDARGLSQTITRELRPRLVRLRFATRPRGLQLRIQDTMLRAPQNIVSWPGYRIHVDAPKQIKKGEVRRFLKWSDGRKRRHIIRTPSKRRTYRAFFD